MLHVNVITKFEFFSYIKAVNVLLQIKSKVLGYDFISYILYFNAKFNEVKSIYLRKLWGKFENTNRLEWVGKNCSSVDYSQVPQSSVDQGRFPQSVGQGPFPHSHL